MWSGVVAAYRQLFMAIFTLMEIANSNIYVFKSVGMAENRTKRQDAEYC